MKTAIVVLCSVMLWALAASAQVNLGANGIGIYADLGGLTNEVELEAGTPMEVYLLLTRPTGQLKLGGWECHIDVPDNVVIWGWNHPHPGTMTFATPPDFMSVFTPIPYAGVNHLMTFIIVPLDAEPARFFIGPHPDFDVTLPRYLDADYDGPMIGNLIDAIPYAGDDEPCFVVNGGSVPITDASWGEVRALYR